MTDIRIKGMGNGCASSEALAELENPSSTSAILQRAAVATGRKDEPAALACQETYRETKASQQLFAQWTHDAKALAAGSTHVMLELAEHAIVHVAPRVGQFAGPVAGAIAAYETAMMLPHAWERGDDRAQALLRDSRFLALVFSVEGLPPGYVQGEIAKRPEVTGTEQSPANVIAFKLRSDKPAMALLQVRVDEGMKVAERCITARQTRESFFQAEPELARRWVSEPAFRVGFDAVIHAQTEGAASLEKTLGSMHGRDVRSTSTSTNVFAG